MPTTGFEVLLSNIARRWKQAIEDDAATETLVFSPYITSTTADSVFGNVDARSCTIYTIFSAENFAQGSSSIKTVKKLNSLGFTIYHLEKLHAKAVVAAEDFASIGSQNLTLQGTRNREASVIINDKQQVARLRQSFARWTQDAQVISAEMIIEMEKMIIPLQKAFRKAKGESAGIDDQIFDAEANRIKARDEQAAQLERERQRIDNERKVRQQRRTKLNETINNALKVSGDIYGSVKGPVFIPQAHRNFTEWASAGNPVSLARTYRYLCIIRESGKLAWVRVMRHRLSFIQRGLGPKESFEIDNIEYKLTLYATWPDDAYKEGNLRLRFSRNEDKLLLTCNLWFGLDEITLIDHKNDGMPSAEVVSILAQIINPQSVFRQKLFDRMFNPFKYTKKLVGDQASTFFGYGTHRMVIHQVSNNRRVLVATQLA